MYPGIKGKTVIITGGSRGIGAACARLLGRYGANVIVNYIRNRNAAERVLNEIRNEGGKGIIIQADVRSREDVERMVEITMSEFGSIDVLVNNANIDFPIKPFVELTWDEIHSKITGEMAALYNCSRAVLKHMMERRSGKIIFISSGLSRHPGYGFAAHAAAKAAMDGIARVMAMELGPYGITVNVVGPGLVLTDATAWQPKEWHDRVREMTPLKRIGEPIDVAGVVLFLASSISDFINGQYIPVNGGIFMI